MAQKNVTIRAAVEGGDKVKAELRDIGAAATGGLGTVSQKAGEAAGGLDKAAGGTSRLNGALGRLVNGGGLRNTAQQLNQVVQSGVATGNWTTALAVQMPDLLLGFGTFGAVAGAVAGFLIPLAANLFTTRDSVDALEESVKRMNSSFGEYKKAVDLLLSEDLAAQFGTLADAIRPVLDALQENRRLTAVDEIRKGVRTAVDEIVKGGINAENALEVWDDLAEDFGLNVTNIFGNFVEGGREVGAQVRALRDAAVAFDEVSKAGGGLADQLLSLIHI